MIQQTLIKIYDDKIKLVGYLILAIFLTLLFDKVNNPMGEMLIGWILMVISGILIYWAGNRPLSSFGPWMFWSAICAIWTGIYGFVLYYWAPMLMQEGTISSVQAALLNVVVLSKFLLFVLIFPFMISVLENKTIWGGYMHISNHLGKGAIFILSLIGIQVINVGAQIISSLVLGEQGQGIFMAVVNNLLSILLIYFFAIWITKTAKVGN